MRSMGHVAHLINHNIPWRGLSPSFTHKLEFPSPKMLCAKFCWNWPSGSGGYFYILPFHNYLSFKKGVALHLINLNSPSSKKVLFQVWLSLAQWFWRRRFFNFVNPFLPFCNYLQFKKCEALNLKNMNLPFT